MGDSSLILLLLEEKTAKHQNCNFCEPKEELKRTEKNLKELKLSK